MKLYNNSGKFLRKTHFSTTNIILKDNKKIFIPHQTLFKLNFFYVLNETWRFRFPGSL